jgi:hypothetical protein
MTITPLASLPKAHFSTILADPPFEGWVSWGNEVDRNAGTNELVRLPRDDAARGGKSWAD